MDELGKLTAKTYPGSEWVLDKTRATFILNSKRDGVSHLKPLEKVIQTFPADRWLIIEDNLSSHPSRETKIALTA